MSKREEASKKLEISNFLQSWKPLKDELDALMECENSEIAKLTADAVKEADRDDLNKHILQKRAIERVFQIVEEMRENLHPDEVSEE